VAGNLPGILEAGCLQADSLVDRGSLLVEAADLKIKADRKKIRITLAPHGCVADYVPFYFAPRSSMLFKLAKGGVERSRRGARATGQPGKPRPSTCVHTR
jgi:hypothetical protein